MRLVLRDRIPGWTAPVAVAVAVAITVLVTALPIRLAGANPAAAFERYLVVPLSSANGIYEVMLAATPLLFTGIAVAIAFRAGYWNIGAEGQFLLGAIGVTAVGTTFTELPAWAALPLGLLTGGVFLRLVRTNVIGTLGREYVEAGRSRGVGEYRLLTKHAYRPALIPIITVMGLQFAELLAGTIVVESVFYLPGLGRLIFQSIANRDLIVVRNCVMLLAAMVVIVNFVVDVLYAVIDPRVKAAEI